jgi:hypothetical protein
VEPEIEEEVLRRVRLGKQKGLVQVLHERGMLDAEKYEEKLYGVRGKKEKDVVIIPGSFF